MFIELSVAVNSNMSGRYRRAGLQRSNDIKRSASGTSQAVVIVIQIPQNKIESNAFLLEAALHTSMSSESFPRTKLETKPRNKEASGKPPALSVLNKVLQNPLHKTCLI